MLIKSSNRNSGMTSQATIGLSLAVLFLATSCASLKPPVRPDYTGADSVDAANVSQLVGAWSVSSLNPYPEEQPQQTIIEYKQDGTVTGMIEPQGESSEVLGNMRFELTGDWTLIGDQVKHSNIEMNTSSDNAMGAMVSKLINNSKGIAGEGNIYEISANRMVIVGTDGSAMEYIRR